jgi:hypothetical protein
MKIMKKDNLTTHQYIRLKGKRSEENVDRFIKNNLIEKLKREWDYIYYEPFAWINYDPFPQIDAFDNWNEKIFISMGYCLSLDYNDKIKSLMDTLLAVPDGYIFKMKKIKNIRITDALKKYNIGRREGWELQGKHKFDGSKVSENKWIPLVDGDIDFIEIKSKGATFNQNQKESYPIAISKGYKMHYFEVNYKSIKKNEYKIEYKLIKKIKDFHVI